MADWVALPTSDHGVVGLNPTGDEILPEPKLSVIAQSLPHSPFHRPDMTEKLLKGMKPLTHLSIWNSDESHRSIFACFAVRPCLSNSREILKKNFLHTGQGFL